MKRATRICTTALSSFPHFARSGATPFWYYLAALLPLQISASAKEKGGRQRGRAGAGRPGADKGGGGTTSCSGRAGRKRLGAAMGRRAVGLLLVTLLIMSGNRAEDCGEEEYWHKGLCCVLCPAGTYVSQHCTTPHSKGSCVSCTKGEDYTAHANGLDECLLCRQCRDDQITLRACTPTHDTECQCKQGYFCPAEGCEICQRCSKTCPEGKEIVQNCNATMDLGCGLPDQGNTSLIWIFAIISVVAVLVVVFIFKKLRRDKATSPDKVEKSLVHKWLKYLNRPLGFVGLSLFPHPGQIHSVSYIHRS